MSNQKQRQIFLGFVKAIYKQSSTLSTIFEELLFGKTGICTLEQKQITPITIYIYETIPQLLVIVINNYKERFFDLRNCSVQLQSLKHQMTNNTLSKLQYLLLTNQQEQLLLIFAHSDEKVSFLNLIKFYKKQLKNHPQQINTLFLSTFTLIDSNKSMTISTDEIQKLFCFLKTQSNDQLQKIEEFIRQEENLISEQLSFRQFQRMMKLMECRMQLKNIFQQYNKSKIKSFRFYTTPMMDKAHFRQFLKLEQQQKKNIQKLIWQTFNKQQMISFHGFCQFIMNRQNSAYQSQLQEKQVDLQLPLTSYVCLSSHNTYLTGNQLTSDSRAERYLQDLQNGYRCLEIDIHNGEKEPIVKHGYTMTSSITFEDVIKCIAEFSKNNSKHTPIILSLQNHTDAPQQKMMAQILKQHFGSKFLLIDQGESQSGGVYPSLKSNLGKIIIKNSGNYSHYKTVCSEKNVSAKSLDDRINNSIIIEQEEDKEMDTEDIAEEINNRFEKILDYSEPHLEKIKQFTVKSHELQKRKAFFLNNKLHFNKALKSNFNLEKKKHKIVPELLIITSMLGNGSLEKPCIWQSISLSEGKIQKIMMTRSKMLKQHTEKHWIRSYPSGARVDSSNYNPLPALELGVQIIALNSQNADHYSLLLREYFRFGARKCRGYRIKSSKVLKKPADFKIRPISCLLIRQTQQSQSIPNVSVNLAFLGVSQDMKNNKKYENLTPFTQIVKKNAYNPIFDNPQTMKLTINCLEKAFLWIEVPQCGIAVLALQGLRKGYRTVSLLDNSFWPNGSLILFKFDFDDYE